MIWGVRMCSKYNDCLCSQWVGGGSVTILVPTKKVDRRWAVASSKIQRTLIEFLYVGKMTDLVRKNPNKTDVRAVIQFLWLNNIWAASVEKFALFTDPINLWTMCVKVVHDWVRLFQIEWTNTHEKERSEQTPVLNICCARTNAIAHNLLLINQLCLWAPYQQPKNKIDWQFHQDLKPDDHSNNSNLVHVWGHIVC